MSHLSAGHGTVSHEEALGTAQKGLTPGLLGWRRWGGAERGVGVVGGRETRGKTFMSHVYALVMTGCAMSCAGVGHLF